MKKLTKTWIAVICVVAVLLLSMVGSYLVQTSFFTVKQEVTICPINELAETINNNIEAAGKDLEPATCAGSGMSQLTGQISLTTYIPKNATSETPAPAIVSAHGWNNSKEMQIQNFVELSRRGFVVVAVDLAGHGRSDASIGDDNCVLAATEYAMSLPYVDETKVGAVGHSAGDLAIGNTILKLNKEGSKKHVSAYCCSAGALSAFILGMGNKDSFFGEGTHVSEGLLIDVIAGKNEEMGDMSSWLRVAFTGFAHDLAPEEGVPFGEWHNAEGKVETPEFGQKIGTDSAIIIHEANVTHPGAVMSVEVTSMTIEFFYAAFGVPTGAKLLATGNQTWVVGVVFQLLGLLAFFASIFVFGAALLKRKRFASLVNQDAPVGDMLPSIKSWKEIVPLLLTFIPLAILAYFMYFPCFDAGAGIIQSNNITPVVSGVAWYTLASGLVLFALIGVNYLIKRLCYIKDNVQVESLLVSAKLNGGVKQFLNTVLFCVELIVLMYIPVFIGYYVFDMTFGISIYVVGLPRLRWLPEVLFKYLPMWLAFLIPNAMLNVKARFKEVPEWASTLFVALANVLPIVILTAVNYGHLAKTGLPLYTTGDPSIYTWTLFAPLVLIAPLNRYFYRKTGNIWAGAIISATILTLMATTITRHTSDFAFFF
ncbi:MAG: alpha/beta hydrolase [Clostridiales bacterium]|nr:alpha/beta hydrolase [Clostridiales bacterium]